MGETEGILPLALFHIIEKPGRRRMHDFLSKGKSVGIS
jgi:hypothetical protein